MTPPAPKSGASAEPGLLQWFWPGDRARVEETLADLRGLGVRHLRTGVSWADWFTPHGRDWYAWLIPRLAEEVELLPCFLYTPPSLGLSPKSSAPPREPKAYADFLDAMMTEFGRYFEWVELWNEPNNISEWDWTLDPEWNIFCEMVGGAAHWARVRGKKTVLGGMSPTDPNWLRHVFDHGLTPYIDAVGIHGFPGVWESSWEGWESCAAKVRRVLHDYRSPAQVWITEVGFSTWRYEEQRQLREFVRALDAPVDRMYWYSAYDLHPDRPTVDGFHSDEREYHFGLKRYGGQPKLLHRIWAESGLDAVRAVASVGRAPGRGAADAPRALVTGGAGFIGSRVAEGLAAQGREVLVLDNLSRPGTERTARALEEARGPIRVEVADVRDRCAVRAALDGVFEVYHFASAEGDPEDPERDFGTHCVGTFNLLEELRRLVDPPALVVESSREPQSFFRAAAEGCVLGYARRYRLPAVALRLGPVFGPGESPRPDAPSVWMRAALRGLPAPVAGDGRRVRDLLYVDDAAQAFVLAAHCARAHAGALFDVAPGPSEAISDLELAEIISEVLGRPPIVRLEEAGTEQRTCGGTDARLFCAATGWAPRVGLREGLQRLHRWLAQEHPATAGRALPWGAGALS